MLSVATSKKRKKKRKKRRSNLLTGIKVDYKADGNPENLDFDKLEQSRNSKPEEWRKLKA